MKYITITLLIIGCFFSKNLPAQNVQPSEFVNPTTEQGILNKILNGIYFTYYSPTYISNKTPVFTILKVDVSKTGKITDIIFSDNTDAAFKNAYLNNNDIESFKKTLERYAQQKSYLNTSMLIPISYQPNSPNKEGVFTYDNIQSLTKFKGQSFIGSTVILPTVIISVLSKNNM
ncbi:hypothetical protein IDJ75_03150 [Mucilaginibacter rigui]|uniref:Uncharacterized protein n=1 Tax=Mucilaginibacter rigui TaxID=534635 RepID=A0ABR7X0Z7_9SPHI|nr:hypothetical protein [Mucilaginibacter rigui]MBD1384262.1 hypothetical protein [Mucilaginibacter rigui]